METRALFNPDKPIARDVGLGTAYERIAVWRLLQRWYSREPPKTAVEGPLDGFAGMPGLHLLPLAERGTRVTVVVGDQAAADRVRAAYARARVEDHLETSVSSCLPDERFDLVLSFNGLTQTGAWREYLRALGDRASQLAVFVSHRHTYGAYLSRLVRRSAKAPEFLHEATGARALEIELERIGNITQRAWVDCPWWPDLFVESGTTLAEEVFGRRRRKRFVFDAANLPLPGRLSEDLSRVLSRHPSFEHSRLAPIFAHHRAYRVLRSG